MIVEPAKRIPLWHDPSSPKGDALTDEMVDECQNRLGVTLPAEYLRLLREVNGGELRRTRFPMVIPTGWADDHVSIYELAGIDREDGERAGLPNLSNYLVREWDYPAPSVVLYSDGHTAFLLDYRDVESGCEPRVVYYEDGNAEENTIHLADTFEEFVRQLEYDSQWHSIGLTDIDDETQLLPILEAFGDDFGESLTGGPKMFLSEYESLDEQEAQFWISPNEYSDGSGWQFFEYPECRWVLTTNVATDQLTAFLLRVDEAALSDVVVIARAKTVR